jgi:hypothetical protein
MNRFPLTAALAIVGIATASGWTAAGAQYPACYAPPQVVYSSPAPFHSPAPVPYAPAGTAPFVGSSYSFYSPSYVNPSYYTPPPAATTYYRGGARPYLDPGPYYYTPAYSYTPGYYSYYYTPGYFRY